MEYRMRRSRQQMPDEDSKEILKSGSNGVLSLKDADGEPYGVPVSYAYDGERCIYLHSALKGHKIDCIETDGRCSFCVVAADDVVPEEFTTYYKSVIVRGKISIMKDADEIMRGLKLLCDKYSAGIDSSAEIAKFIKHVAVLRIDIESITGKEAKELTAKRENVTC